MAQHPLEVEELLRYCLTFVAPYRSDLLACALVARSWTDPAQSHLFRAPYLANLEARKPHHVLSKFHAALSSNPRLLHHVRRLTFAVEDWFYMDRALEPATVDQICNLAFTRLESLCIRTYKTVLNSFSTLLTLPTLRRLELSSANPDALAALMPGPSIQHLDLYCFDNAVEFAFPNSVPMADITLISLRLDLWGSPYSLPGFHPSDVAPFNLTQLKALSFRITPSFSVGAVIKDMQCNNIEVLELDFLGDYDGDSFDLGLFPNLRILRINSWGNTSTTLLSTLASAVALRGLRTIFVALATGNADWTSVEKLDPILASFPSLAVVKIEPTRAGDIDKVAELLPSLTSKGLVCFRSL
ncbi:hypothetical protein R3P38DRAFT_3115241 [Favolaschia claudopus]|uniref:F-box domain-containing protein n=1 Tax=Favolaschia claudopus TaxID=2862362 RepID=A0AAV9ZG04_9AGAR